MTEARSNGGLSANDLDAVFDQLAAAIDAVGPDEETMFLARLALLLADALGDRELVSAAIATAAAGQNAPDDAR